MEAMTVRRRRRITPITRPRIFVLLSSDFMIRHREDLTHLLFIENHPPTRETNMNHYHLFLFTTKTINIQQ